MKSLLSSLIILFTTGHIYAQCIQNLECPLIALEFCDFTPNNPLLWNDLDWWDSSNQIHDLADTPVDVAHRSVDTCSGALVSMRYLLFLDLDQNGSWETVIKSWEPPAPGTVNFDNEGNPNYDGGEVRFFDERPVPVNEKYQFALESIVSGDTINAKLRWNTLFAPTTFINPELPYGTHKIKWLTDDDQGNNQICEYPIVVKDCKAPTVVCITGFSVNIMPTGFINLWATDFLQYTDDNYSPNPLLIAVRKCGAGAGFPEDSIGNPITNIDFYCNEIGTQCVELWAKDAAGNADYCETNIIIQDNLGNCGNSGVQLKACVNSWCDNASILGATAFIDGSVNFAPPFSYFDLMDSMDTHGCYLVTNNIPLSSTFVIAPEKDDFPLNGVTVLDLIKIKRFLLGYELDLSPYAMIAADVNKSGSITGFDLIELRRLLTGVYTELPNNTSWRFIDHGFTFPNVQNPFQTAFPETISIANAVETAYQASFKAIKIGDLDCDAWPGLQAPIEDRGLPVQYLSLPDATLLEGESAEISLQMSQSGDWSGLQMGLQFNPEKLEILEVLTGELPGLDADAFYQPRPGVLNFVWVGAQAERIGEGQDLLKLRVRAKTPLKVSAVFQVVSNYEHLGSLGDAPQSLGLEFREPETYIANTKTIFFAPLPNPTKAGTSIPLQLAQAGAVTLAITTPEGKTFWANRVELNAGNQLLEIPAQAFPQAGVYLWQVIAGGETASGKLVKI